MILALLALVLVIMGVSGAGKSTVAGILAERLGWDLAEGDDLHPAANIAKMSAGTPLTDGTVSHGWTALPIGSKRTPLAGGPASSRVPP